MSGLFFSFVIQCDDAVRRSDVELMQPPVSHISSHADKGYGKTQMQSNPAKEINILDIKFNSL